MENPVAFPSIHIADCSLNPTLISECRLSAPCSREFTALRPAEQQTLRDNLIAAVWRHMASSHSRNQFGQGAFIRCRYLDSQRRTVALSDPTLVVPHSGFVRPKPGTIFLEGNYRLQHSMTMPSFSVQAYFPQRLPSCVAEVIFEVTPPIHPFRPDRLQLSPPRHLYEQMSAIDYSFEPITLDADTLRRLSLSLPYEVSIRIPARQLHPTALATVPPPPSFLDLFPILPIDIPQPPKSPESPQSPQPLKDFKVLKDPKDLRVLSPSPSLNLRFHLSTRDRPRRLMRPSCSHDPPNRF